MEITADDLRWRCPCGYSGKYMQVHMHRVNSKQPECKTGPMKTFVPDPATLLEEEEEEELQEVGIPANSSWETEGPEEEAEPVATSESAPVAPARASGPSPTIKEPSQPPSPVLRMLDVEPTGAQQRIKLTAKNLSYFDLSRGQLGFNSGGLEDWVNEVIQDYFESFLGIELVGQQVIPAGG